jgi:HTH-type transcriptional regulator/antitoxin HipB
MQHRIVNVDQLGLLLQSARKAAHCTQARLACQLGLSQSRLSKIEQNPGSATVQQLLALCGVLGIELMMQSKSRPSAPGDDVVCAPEW